MGEGFSLANQLRYFGKSGYLATITSESENDIVTEKQWVMVGWEGLLNIQIKMILMILINVVEYLMR